MEEEEAALWPGGTSAGTYVLLTRWQPGEQPSAADIPLCSAQRPPLTNTTDALEMGNTVVGHAHPIQVVTVAVRIHCSA